MHLENFASPPAPLEESVDMEKFFQGAGRKEIFQSLIVDILAEKPLLKLVGKEGSGKTGICRLIASRLPDASLVVSLRDPSGSFEELLRMVCLELGMEPRRPSDQVEALSEVQRLLTQAHDQGKRVVLVIDEAEKLFLATLERLVRHVSGGDGELQLTLVLVGRPELDDKLKQIASLSTGVSFSNSYTLADLSESETRQYLRFRVETAGMSRAHFSEVFTEEVVNKIFTVAKGNLRLVNMLAEEALQSFGAEKSFMALLDQVEPATGIEPEPRPSRRLLLNDLLRSRPIVTTALIGAVVLVLVGGLLLKFMSTAPPRLEPVRREASVQVATHPRPVAPQQGQRDPQAILQDRLKAGAEWLAGLYQEKYTIQLMMLSSPMAQSRLAGTLATEEYAPFLDQIYILRTQATPPALLVYYGVYDSLDGAREARNSMPFFLRQHQPYPLSISQAMEKMSKQ